MFADRFDRLAWAALAVTLAGLAALLFAAAGDSGGGQGGRALDRALEREMAYQARVAYLQKLYAPVEVLRGEGQAQAALLKLKELERSYPAEAHGFMLKAALLEELGAFEEAVSSYVLGVKLRGDYLDADSPLSRRAEIDALVARGIESVGRSVREERDNPTLAATLKDLYYLQSRLAGGCE